MLAANILNSVLRPFQDYFSSYETGQSVDGRKREDPEKNHLAHPQAKLGLSHMWPERDISRQAWQDRSAMLTDCTVMEKRLFPYSAEIDNLIIIHFTSFIHKPFFFKITFNKKLYFMRQNKLCPQVVVAREQLCIPNDVLLTSATRENLSSGLLTKPDRNRIVQSQRKATGLK